MSTPAPTDSSAAATANSGSENCLPIGTRLSDFEITGILGEGGFGIVYIAYDHSLQRTVAIKEYMPGALALRGGDHGVSLRAERHQDTFRLGLKSFINEARFLAQFDHPSLVKVYRFWEQNRTAYTAMQYYEGRTIKDIVANSPELVDEAWCRKLLTQMLQALEMLYTMKILHRDISPDNIIVQASGDAVLLDFGSARQIIGDMTKGLTVILKPGYAPVEQYAGDASLEQGAFTDIYALAAVIYFAIAKAPPPSSIARMIKDPVTPLHDQAPSGFSASFLAAIDKGLAVLSQDRPQTIDEFRELLGIVSLGPPPPLREITQRGAPVTRDDAPLPVEPEPMAQPSLPQEPLTQKPILQQPDHQQPAPAAVPASAKPAMSAIAARNRWSFIAAAMAIVMTSGLGLYALVHNAGDDTIMVALPQTPTKLPSAVTVPAKEVDSSEPVAEAAPAATSSPKPQETPAPAAAELKTTAAAESKAESAAAAKIPPPAVETVAYKLTIKPWGTVYVDGRERGVSPPMKRLTLPVGKHNIRIVNPNFPDHSINLESGKNKSATIEHDFAAAKK